MEILQLMRKKNARLEIFHLDAIISGTLEAHYIFQSMCLSAAR